MYLIILSPLLSYFRKIKFTENIITALNLISHISQHLDQPTVLNRIVPYHLHILDDDEESTYCALVKSRAILELNDCLKHSKYINVDNMSIFGEIIFRVLVRASKHESELIRGAVARTVLSFSLLAMRYLRAKHKYLKNKFKDVWKPRFYSNELVEYKERIKEIILELINKPATNGSTASKVARETLFPLELTKLCHHFRFLILLLYSIFSNAKQMTLLSRNRRNLVATIGLRPHDHIVDINTKVCLFCGHKNIKV